MSYGIDNSTLTVWVDNRAILEREQAGRLCRRHADALVVPRGWTIDDRRQPVPQLFRVVDNEVPERVAAPSLFEAIEAELKQRETEAEDADVTAAPVDPDETKAIPWSPRLVPTDGDDNDDDAPVLGRLMGRAFGKKNTQ